MLTINANTAVATANATGNAIVDVVGITASGNVNVSATGYSFANVDVDNLSIAAMSVGLMSGAAKAAGTFNATFKVSGTATITGDLSITANYQDVASAEVIPAGAGVSGGLASIGANTAVALANTVSKASIEGAGTVNVNKIAGTTNTGNVTVTNTGIVKADADVGQPYFTVAAVTVTSNIAVATLAAQQSAGISCGTLSANGAVIVTSNTNETVEDGKYPMANATLGKNSNLWTGKSETGYSVTISAVAANVNVAVALADVTSHAYISGTNLTKAPSLKVTTNGTSIANADVTVSATLGYMAVGLNNMTATSAGDFRSFVDTKQNANVSADSISVETTYESQANAASRQPNGGVGATLAAYSYNANIATAVAKTIAEAKICGSGKVTATTGKIIVKVTGNGKAEATNEQPKVSVSGINIAANVNTATFAATQKALIDGPTVSGKTGVEVTSTFNEDGKEAATAYIGGTGVSASLVGAGVSTAVATAAVTSIAKMQDFPVADTITAVVPQTLASSSTHMA